MIDFLLKITHATNVPGICLNPFGFRPMRRMVVLAGLLALLPALAQTQTAKTYRDGHKGTVTFPLGDLSFADEVVSFQMGEPHASPLYSDPRDALGPPNYDEKTDIKVRSSKMQPSFSDVKLRKSMTTRSLSAISLVTVSRHVSLRQKNSLTR